jgi:hypothetical protein
MYIFDNIALQASYNEKYFRKKNTEKIKTLVWLNNVFNHVIYQMIWKNMLKPDRPQMTIWRVRFACWMHKAINTHLECVIVIAFPLQQWLHCRASMFRYTQIYSPQNVIPKEWPWHKKNMK